MGIPEIIVKKKKKPTLIRRFLGYDIFFSLALLFGLLWFVPEVLLNTVFPQIGVVVPEPFRSYLLLFAFWMQLFAFALVIIFALSLIQKLGRGRRKKIDRVRLRRVPTTPSVPPHRVEKHNAYLAEAIKETAEAETVAVEEQKKKK